MSRHALSPLLGLVAVLLSLTSFSAVLAAPSTVYYSSLVAIGASYTDNAHPRAAEYASSLRQYYPYDRYGGRYSNGIVAVEYMVRPDASPKLKQTMAGVKLLDYAFGGSVVRNGLSGTSSGSPGAEQQVAMYLSDIRTGAAPLGNGRVLHYANSGINVVSQVWNAAIASGLSANSISTAQAAITANTAVYGAALRSISTDARIVARGPADFLIVGIPALELVPTFPFQVPATWDDTRKRQAIAFVGQLASQWNNEMRTFTAALKTQVAGKGGRVFYYDLAQLFKSMHSSPASFGITASPTTKTCYNSTTGAICTNPAQYLYFDTLHPVTSVHKLMAQKMNGLVLGLTA